MSGVFASTAAAIGIIDKAVSITQKLSDNSPELDKATLKLELANLMVELASVKMEVISLQALVFDAEQKNKKLVENLNEKASFKFIDGLYWKDNEDIPYCTKCYEGKDKKLHLEPKESYIGIDFNDVKYRHWACIHCDKTYDRS
ncbi:hypothetical protein [Pantoea dispersa]|uniref:hypothetical protein n=1 Tax=Pantoea dispersa TaxID=59814 RepID=UPI001331BBB6|nr:hypothetical protein [Pantoea dispersa]KAF0856740.1 hypothetical protein Y788_04825 [Pantoea dispersa 625]